MLRKKLLLAILAVLLLSTGAQAVGLPDDLRAVAPEAAALIEEDGADFGLVEGLNTLLDHALEEGKSYFFSGLHAAAVLLAGIVLLGATQSLMPDGMGGTKRCISLISAVWITAISVGEVDRLIGLGAETIEKIALLTKLMLPVVASAAAASGGITGAALRHSAAVFFSDLLVTAIRSVLLPSVYLYIGIAVAQAVLEEDAFAVMGRMLKKACVWTLRALLILFTGYMTVSGAITGAADAAAVKLTRTAISAAVPIVGNILAEAAESLVAGASALRGLLGAFGALAVLGICLVPVVKLGIQYLLYRAVGIAAAVSGHQQSARLLDMLGDAFAMILAMTASSAMLLIISLVSAMMVSI